MEKRKINTILKKTFIGLLAIVCFGVLLPSQIKAEEHLQLVTQIVLNEDTTSADISFDLTSLGKEKIVTEVKSEDGTILDLLNNATYTVKNNGTYAFDVQYQEGETTKSFTQEVVVTDIKKQEDKEVTPTQGVLTLPRSSSNASGDRLTTTSSEIVERQLIGRVLVNWIGTTTTQNWLKSMPCSQK